MLPIIVLAGGFGTRLRSAVSSVPKPLAPVNGKPFLHYLLEEWRKQDVHEFVFALHHQSAQIEEYLENCSEDLLKHCEVQVCVESTPMGTGGAIANIVHQCGLRKNFLVSNADTWVQGDLSKLVSAPSPAIAVLEVPDSSRYGRVDFVGGKVRGFHEKQNVPGGGLVNAGLYHLSPEPFLKNDFRSPFALETTFLKQWASEGALSGVQFTQEFIDIGVPEDYFRFCKWVEKGMCGPL